MNLQKLSAMLLNQVEWLVKEAETQELTNEQWYIEWENSLNLISVKDHHS